VSGALRIGAFLVVLAVVLLAATALGDAVGPLERGAEPADTDAAHGEEPAHGGTPPGEGPAGLAVASAGLRLVPEETRLRAGETHRFAFRIVDAQGETVKRFEETHEREMHLIVVRRDLTGFQHLHPEMDADGTWTTDLDLAEAGTYRALADFSADDRRVVLGVDVVAPGPMRAEPLPAPATSVTVDGYRVWLHEHRATAGTATELAFPIFRDGDPVEPEPYLGARGHLVVLREGDLAYLHTHPHDDELEFETTFPSAGLYRAFLQFAHEGRVRTAAFTIEVGEG
jgi:hypothetical protein